MRARLPYKSKSVSVFAIRNFKFLGFALGRNGSGIYVRVHPKSWKKLKSKLKDLSSRKSVQCIKPSLAKIKVYARGWLNYYGIASMKNNIDEINDLLLDFLRLFSVDKALDSLGLYLTVRQMPKTI